ncbi:MAG TPA: transcriptional regulator [Planctomycetes bacterium]|nr:transcriptional regulator [Planctomycetota bacterium]
MSSKECDPTCPVKKTAEIVGTKWTTLIIRDLLTGTKRYSQLKRSLKGISPKMLSDRLRMLSKRGMIQRRVLDTNPPTTEYSLTPLGKQLEGVIQAMAAFGEKLGEASKPSNGG